MSAAETDGADSRNGTEPLAGRCIALAESRELDVFAGLLQRRGAQVLRYPLVQIVDAPDPVPILQWARCLATGGLDDVILLTGEGLRRICRCLQLHEPALQEPFLKALCALRKITRGPKPARALRELGLSADVAAAEPTSAGVIQTLRTLSLSGHRIGLQLYGEDPNEALVSYLRGAGAEVYSVAPYRYADAVSDTALEQLLERMRRGEIDAIAFTSKAQVQRLFRSRDADGVRRALAASNVAAVGPLVAAALAEHGVVVKTMPASAWFMKPLTAALVEAMSSAARAANGHQEDGRT
ncbi:MAG TPA: uroporphyrinogen-III synthase [Steroidobacteraceae bacterium]|jgi:uroporphyrinogen-III synthase|nr:uroporphyrinogen-III synthase [Steroidobacteraceae bacterium]